MAVAHRHCDRLVTERLLQFLQRPATLHEPGRERVTQIMKPEALDTGRGQRGLPGAAERVPLARPEHVPLCAVRPPTGQNGVSVQTERHFATPTALRQLQPDHAPGTVNAVPCQPEGFTLPQAREQTELDNI